VGTDFVDFRQDLLLPRDLTDPLITGGQALLPRQQGFVGSGTGLTSGFCRFTYATVCRTEQVSTAFAVQGTAAGATPTLCQFGLYTEDSAGNLTLVASTPNDTTLFQGATNAQVTKALSSPYTLIRGQRIAWTWMMVTGAAAPAVWGLNNAAAGWATESFRRPRTTSLVTGQASLPGSVATGSLGAGGFAIYSALV
jgi:hypothetical protein